MPEWWEGTFEERMARRAARREAETPAWLRDTPEELKARELRSLKRHQSVIGRCFHKPPEKRKRSRPSDGQESGAPFNVEEYLTRLEDRKAANPEEWQRQQRAKKEESRAFWDRYKFQHELDRANEEMVEEVKRGEEVGVSRLRQIWHCVWHEESEQRWRTSPTLSQAERIKITPRIKGCGAAAKRAGFAG